MLLFRCSSRREEKKSKPVQMPRKYRERVSEIFSVIKHFQERLSLNYPYFNFQTYLILIRLVGTLRPSLYYVNLFALSSV